MLSALKVEHPPLEGPLLQDRLVSRTERGCCPPPSPPGIYYPLISPAYSKPLLSTERGIPMVQLGKLVESVTIPAAHGRAVVVRGGQKVKVTDVEGKQVCDFFALRASDPSVYLSGVYTRSTIARVRPRVGDTLFDNHRIAIIAFLEDTTIGIHDMLYAPCDPQRYLIDYEVTEHRSCKGERSRGPGNARRPPPP